MDKDKLLLILTFVGSTLCWWPAMPEPSLDFPRWILLVLIASITGLSIALSPRQWLLLVITVMAGAFAGLFAGCLLFPSDDELSNADAPLFAAIVTLVAWLIAFVAGLIARKLPASNKHLRRAIWVALISCVAFGPVGLAITPPTVNRRVARNDRLAAARFQSLKVAAEQTKAEKLGRGLICDSDALRRHYSGPQLSEQNWQRIGKNFATHNSYGFRQDDYAFMVKCREDVGYTLDAMPEPFSRKLSAKRKFCSDQCKEWLQSQHLCSACTE